MTIADITNLNMTTAIINIIVGTVNIGVSLGLIWCARTNIKTAKTLRALAEQRVHWESISDKPL